MMKLTLWDWLLLFMIVIITHLLSNYVGILKHRSEQQSDSLIQAYKEIDTLKRFNIEFAKFVHIEKERYLEQCRVDSVQDNYMQLLNIRTAPLLSGEK